MGFKILAGTLPDGAKNEIAVSEYIFEVFKKAQYFDGKTYAKDKSGIEKPVYVSIVNYGDLVGKTLSLSGTEYKITAVIATSLDMSRYDGLTVKSEHKTNAEQLVDYVLYNEYNTEIGYSFAGAIMVGDGFVEGKAAERPPISPITEGAVSFYGESYNADSQYLARLSDVKNEKIIWIDGEKSVLAANEIVVTADALYCTEDSAEADADYAALLKNKNSVSMWKYLYTDSDNYDEYTDGYKIVGVIDNMSEGSKSALYSTVVCSDGLYNEMTDGLDGLYEYAVGKMPEGREAVSDMATWCYNNNDSTRYAIQNSVTFELDSLNTILKELSKVFLWIGVGFALFAAIMLANFIGTSISYKKQEIGILRAIGSRSNDVFRIFFAESFIIAMINFVLSAVGVCVATLIINSFIRNTAGVLVTVLSFGVRQVVLLFAVSIAVAFTASFLPVKRIASKRPIDAIRGR